MNLFGNGDYHAALVWAVIPKAIVLLRKGKFGDREVHRTEGHGKGGTEIGFMLACTKECQELPIPTEN